MDFLMRLDLGHLSPNLQSLDAAAVEAFTVLQDDLARGQGPLGLSFAQADSLPKVKSLAAELGAKYENVLLLGIGGSALGARAVLQFLKGPYYNLDAHGLPRLFIFDNLDPVAALKLDELLDWRKTAVVYVSKSGSTPETAANFVFFFERYRRAGGRLEDLVIICDPAENGINRIAQDLGCHLLPIPRDLPGRYSVLSNVGFLPAELAGIDSAQLLAGADAVHRYILTTPAEENALCRLGAALARLADKGRTMHVLFNYSSLLAEFGLWFMQLWAESLGKRESITGEVVHAGSTPLSCVGPTDQHSLLQLFKEGPADKAFGFLTIGETPEATMGEAFPDEVEYAYFAGRSLGEQQRIEQLATEMSLVRSGHPCYRLTLGDISPRSLGALFYFYEALVVYTGGLWRVNPFNQPGVEEGKHITYALMGRADYATRRDGYEREVRSHNAGGQIFDIITPV